MFQCYLQCRVRWKGSKLLRHGLQFICLMLSWGTAMSRISDYKHHWSDVLAGLVIGCTTAALTVRFLATWKHVSHPQFPACTPSVSRLCEGQARFLLNGLFVRCPRVLFATYSPPDQSLNHYHPVFLQCDLFRREDIRKPCLDVMKQKVA